MAGVAGRGPAAPSIRGCRCWSQREAGLRGVPGSVLGERTGILGVGPLVGRTEPLAARGVLRGPHPGGADLQLRLAQRQHRAALHDGRIGRQGPGIVAPPECIGRRSAGLRCGSRLAAGKLLSRFTPHSAATARKPFAPAADGPAHPPGKDSGSGIRRSARRRSLRRGLLRAVVEAIVDSVIEKVYSENYAMRKRLNGMNEEESEFNVPGYMRSDAVVITAETDMSNEEQIRAYSLTLQDVYQGLLDEGSNLAAHLAAAMEIFVNGSLNLFNHRTNVDLSNRFIVFDLSGLKDNLRITAMLIMMETVRSKIKENAKEGRWTHLYIDEFHELLAVEQVASFVLKLWKEIRKMSGILNGITQNMSDLLNNDNGGKLQAILSNTEYFALLSQSTLDKNKLMQFLPSISPAMFNFVDNASSGTGLLKMGSVTVPFDMRMDKNSEIYRIVNTDGGGSYGV